MVRRRPPSSVLSRTLASTGSVLLLETARLTTPRPRARFSCITESFTSGHSKGGSGSGKRQMRIQVSGCVAQGSRVPRSRVSSMCVSSSIYEGPSPSSSWCGPGGRARSGPFVRGVDRRAGPVDGPTKPVDGDRDPWWTKPAGRPATPSTSDRLSTPVVPAVRHCVHIAIPPRNVTGAPDSHAEPPEMWTTLGRPNGPGVEDLGGLGRRVPVSRRRSARERRRSRGAARRCPRTRG